jgi:SAM-dependent methyltransferase
MNAQLKPFPPPKFKPEERTMLYHLLCCPKCGGELNSSFVGENIGNLHCKDCRASYPCTRNNIPQLFIDHESDSASVDVTEVVKNFYEPNPFPNYDEFDSKESLAEKARTGVFAHLLDEQMPIGAKVLECGCGTGQFTNFLGMRRDGRVVFGTDMTWNSLMLAENFRARCDIKGANFVQMNLFRPAFKPNTFDVVISNGVLHHTGDPLGGFKSISRLLKPRGYIAIGLYNTIGRLRTDLLRILLHASGGKLKFLDAHQRNPNYTEARKRAWLLDRFYHPHESKHSMGEVLADWFEANGFDFCSGIPKPDLTAFSRNEQLFSAHDPGGAATRFLAQVGLALKRRDAGGLFVMIGRKKR